MTALAPPPGRTEPTDEEIFAQFESLGDNCEFGLVQRTAGVNHLGFFRFNFAALAPLLLALDSDFAGVDDPANVEIEREPNKELMVRIRNYKFRYHTFNHSDTADVGALHRQQVKVIRFLARKALEDLRAAEKIFVRKGRDTSTDEQMAQLLRALRRHGPVTLLWVVLQDEAHPPGSVKVIEPGVMKGYMDRFASFENAFDFSAVWFDVCRNAHALWRDRSPVGSVAKASKRRADANLIRQADRFGGAAWWLPPHAAARPWDKIPPLHRGCMVMEHVLQEATTGETAAVYGYGLAYAVASGSIYVASMSVWLPADFTGTLVGVVFAGFSSIHIVNARLALRGCWQRVWVSARTPPDVTSANPSLFVVGPAGTRLFSTCWKLELGVQPTDFEPPLPALPQAPARAVLQRPRPRPAVERLPIPAQFAAAPLSATADRIERHEPVPPAVAERPPDMTDEQVLGQFESLGDNCEFGLLQRIAGIEPLGFFRLNFAAMPALLEALDRDFAGADLAENVDVDGDPELMVRIRPYGFRYHTDQRRGEVEIEALRSRQIKVIQFGTRKLLDDLRTAEKIFVRKGPDSLSAEQIAPLLRALRRHGPVTLLWVVPRDEAHPPGRVEVIEPGLLKGYIDRFAPYDDAYDLSRVWIEVCRGALRLWRDRNPAGATIDVSPAPAPNLIRFPESFGGSGWQHDPRATSRTASAVPRLHAVCDVIEHVLQDATRHENGHVYSYEVGGGELSAGIHVVSFSVWLPAGFEGELVGAIFAGMDSIRIVNARLPLRERWQRVWVSARISPDAAGVRPGLYIVGPPGARVFSTCWKLERGVMPTEFEPPGGSADPVRTPAGAKAPQAAEDGVHRRAWLAEVCEAGAAERLPYLGESVLEVPPLAFGETDFSHPAIVQSPPHGAAGAMVRHPPVDAYVLHDATVHGQFGVVTCGGMVVAESTTHLQPRRLPGAEWLDESRLRLPRQPPAAILPAAYHLLTCNLDNYFHWLLESVARFDVAVVRGLGMLGEQGRDFVPLLPPFDAMWKRQSFGLLLPADQRMLALPDAASVQVERLLYIPEYAGAGWRAHRALLTVFDRMRAAAYAALATQPAAPSKRLFISRADSPHRMLVNEAEIAGRAARAGFERVVLDGMGVAEQIRLFAEATHILAPHGAGLTNLVFCRPGAAVCELHMDCYVNWAFRGLAALRGLRYGCLIGPHIPPRRDWAHHNIWRIDPAQVEAVLADPRFIGG